jgi:hypothetical protein
MFENTGSCSKITTKDELIGRGKWEIGGGKKICFNQIVWDKIHIKGADTTIQDIQNLLQVGSLFCFPSYFQSFFIVTA